MVRKSESAPPLLSMKKMSSAVSFALIRHLLQRPILSPRLLTGHARPGYFLSGRVDFRGDSLCVTFLHTKVIRRETQETPEGSMKNVALTLAAMLVYILIFKRAGFVIATFYSSSFNRVPTVQHRAELALAMLSPGRLDLAAPPAQPVWIVGATAVLLVVVLFDQVCVPLPADRPPHPGADQ